MMNFFLVGVIHVIAILPVALTLRCYWCSGVGPQRDCERTPSDVTTGPVFVNCRTKYCISTKVMDATSGEVKSFARLCANIPRGNACIRDSRLITCFETCTKDFCNRGNPDPGTLASKPYSEIFLGLPVIEPASPAVDQKNISLFSLSRNRTFSENINNQTHVDFKDFRKGRALSTLNTTSIPNLKTVNNWSKPADRGKKTSDLDNNRIPKFESYRSRHYGRKIRKRWYEVKDNQSTAKSGQQRDNHKLPSQPDDSMAAETPKSLVAEIGSPESLLVDIGSPESLLTGVGSPKSLVADIGSPEILLTDVGSLESLLADIGSPKTLVADIGSPGSLLTDVGSPESLLADIGLLDEDNAIQDKLGSHDIKMSFMSPIKVAEHFPVPVKSKGMRKVESHRKERKSDASDEMPLLDDSHLRVNTKVTNKVNDDEIHSDRPNLFSISPQVHVVNIPSPWPTPESTAMLKSSIYKVLHLNTERVNLDIDANYDESLSVSDKLESRSSRDRDLDLNRPRGPSWNCTIHGQTNASATKWGLEKLFSNGRAVSPRNHSCSQFSQTPPEKEIERDHSQMESGAINSEAGAKRHLTAVNSSSHNATVEFEPLRGEAGERQVESEALRHRFLFGGNIRDVKSSLYRKSVRQSETPETHDTEDRSSRNRWIAKLNAQKGTRAGKHGRKKSRRNRKLRPSYNKSGRKNTGSGLSARRRPTDPVAKAWQKLTLLETLNRKHATPKPFEYGDSIEKENNHNYTVGQGGYYDDVNHKVKFPNGPTESQTENSTQFVENHLSGKLNLHKVTPKNIRNISVISTVKHFTSLKSIITRRQTIKTPTTRADTQSERQTTHSEQVSSMGNRLNDNEKLEVQNGTAPAADELEMAGTTHPAEIILETTNIESRLSTPRQATVPVSQRWQRKTRLESSNRRQVNPSTLTPKDSTTTTTTTTKKDSIQNSVFHQGDLEEYSYDPNYAIKYPNKLTNEGTKASNNKAPNPMTRSVENSVSHEWNLNLNEILSNSSPDVPISAIKYFTSAHPIITRHKGEEAPYISQPKGSRKRYPVPDVHMPTPAFLTLRPPQPKRDNSSEPTHRSHWLFLVLVVSLGLGIRSHLTPSS